MKTAAVTKPNFKSIFKKRLKNALIIAVTAGTLALLLTSFLYRNYCWKDGQTRALRSYFDIRQVYESLGLDENANYEAYCEFLNYVSIGTKIEAEYDYTYYDEDKPYLSYRVIDPDKNILADNKQLVYFYVTTPGEDGPKYYIVHPDIYDDVYNYCLKYDKFFDKNKDVSTCRLRADKAYIDGVYIYPRLKILYTDHEDAGSESPNWKTADTKEFFPEDTSDMRLAGDETGETVWPDFYLSDHTDKKVEDALDGYIKNTDIERFDDGDNYGDTFGGVFVKVFYLTNAIDSAAEKPYVLIYAFPYSFIGRYTNLVVICAVLLLLTAVLTAYITSRLTYADRKARYEIFSARQETTRAMAHDLKTPLTSISGYAELLQEDISPEKQRHYIEMIGQNVSRMNTIVSDILELSKAESDSAALTLETLSVAELISEAVNGLSGAFDSAGLTCKVSVPREFAVRADRKLLTRALTNLLHNAAVYSKRGTDVDITLSGRELRIASIPEQMPDKPAEELMKPFVKGSDARGENTGSGVGLAIADHDLARMGFGLTVEKSSRFTAVCRF